MERINVEDNPTQMMATTKSGQEIDMNNCPGTKKVELVQSGEMGVDQFVLPANMPGSKLKELREANRDRMEKFLTKEPAEPNQFQVGDFVQYQEESYEVFKTDPVKGVLIEKEGKKVWVKASAVEKG